MYRQRDLEVKQLSFDESATLLIVNPIQVANVFFSFGVNMMIGFFLSIFLKNSSWSLYQEHRCHAPATLSLNAPPSYTASLAFLQKRALLAPLKPLSDFDKRHGPTTRVLHQSFRKSTTNHSRSIVALKQKSNGSTAILCPNRCSPSGAQDLQPPNTVCTSLYSRNKFEFAGDDT